MTRSCKRFDAAGHSILPHSDMLIFYKGDSKSIDIIRRWMPFRYVCFPDIEIRVPCGEVTTIDIYLIYPNEIRQFQKEVSIRAVEGLRATFRGKPGWTKVINGGAFVSLRRKGRVVMDPLRRFGVWK